MKTTTIETISVRTGRPVYTPITALKAILTSRIFWMFVFILAACSIGFAFASGSDYLSNSEAAVKSTFGDGSTFEKYLFLGEVATASFTYIKTKSIAALIGIVVLMIFAHVFLTMVFT